MDSSKIQSYSIIFLKTDARCLLVRFLSKCDCEEYSYANHYRQYLHVLSGERDRCNMVAPSKVTTGQATKPYERIYALLKNPRTIRSLKGGDSATCPAHH